MFLQLLKEPVFVYTVEMDVKVLLNLEPRAWDFISRLEPKIGFVEYLTHKQETEGLVNIIHGLRGDICVADLEDKDDIYLKQVNKLHSSRRPKVAVIGSGPAGLFASLVLAEFGAEVTLIERGQAVEQRGRDIGALVVRRILQSESNFCFGEVRYNHPLFSFITSIFVQFYNVIFKPSDNPNICVITIHRCLKLCSKILNCFSNIIISLS